MNPHDPYWTALYITRERAAAFALEREYKRLLAKPGQRPRLEIALGRVLIFAGDRFRALGCRLADACGCPEASVDAVGSA